jgi:hypothetical protein
MKRPAFIRHDQMKQDAVQRYTYYENGEKTEQQVTILPPVIIAPD